MDNSGGVPQATANQREIEIMNHLSLVRDIEVAPRSSNESLVGESSSSIFSDNNRGVPPVTVNQHEIELMKQSLLPSMTKDIKAAPTRSNSENSCSIFRVHQPLAGGILEACRPQIISIGPYHHGESQLQMLQGHKWRYLHTMLDRTERYGIRLENLIDVVAAKEKMIRQCYSESTDNFSRSDLVKMMVLDGCFIIEFVRQDVKLEPQMLPINLLASVSIMRDLLRLENQVPYFVLEDLFEITNVPKQKLPLADLASNFFKYFLQGADIVEGRRFNPKGVHLLDLFRLSLIPSDQGPILINETSSNDMIRSASELRRVGIRVKPRTDNNILEIKFDSKHRTIEIPQIDKYDDDLIWVLPNMVAFEQCCGQIHGHMTAYAMFMGSLVRTADDVQLLGDCKVISNFGISNEDFARFFREVCRNTTFSLRGSYLEWQYATINRSLKCEGAYLCWARLLNAFYENPWSALSGLAVLVTLAGIIQTVYAVLQYYHPK